MVLWWMDTFSLVPLIEIPFWVVKEHSPVTWKITGPWHVVTLTFIMMLIDVLDDTVQNSLPRNLGCGSKKRHVGLKQQA